MNTLIQFPEDACAYGETHLAKQNFRLTDETFADKQEIFRNK